jgi:hypothetical protein
MEIMTLYRQFTPEQITSRTAQTVIEMIRGMKTPLPPEWANKMILEIEKAAMGSTESAVDINNKEQSSDGQ